ncbi:uncharacterized protein [Pleurodeles waltl]
MIDFTSPFNRIPSGCQQITVNRSRETSDQTEKRNGRMKTPSTLEERNEKRMERQHRSTRTNCVNMVQDCNREASSVTEGNRPASSKLSVQCHRGTIARVMLVYIGKHTNIREKEKEPEERGQEGKEAGLGARGLIRRGEGGVEELYQTVRGVFRWQKGLRSRPREVAERRENRTVGKTGEKQRGMLFQERGSYLFRDDSEYSGGRIPP